MSKLRIIIKVSLLGLALAACSAEGDEGASKTKRKATLEEAEPAANRVPLAVRWDGRSLVVTGDGPPGFGVALKDALDQPAPLGCDVRHTTIEVIVPSTDTEALPALPIADLAELICGAKSIDLEFNWKSREIKGLTTFRDLHVEAALGPKYINRVVAPWVYEIGLSTDRDAIPAGFGSVVFDGQASDPTAKWTIRPVIDGAPHAGTFGDGSLALLVPGIYADSNGDHFGVREGFQTIFIPNNPAALYFGGRRFPLDDTVRIYGQAVALGPNSTNPDSIDSCKMNPKKKATRCAPRKDGSGESVDLSDIGKVRSVVNQVVIHSDGSDDTAMERRVLLERNLSTHVAIDFDGTVHQLIDLSLAAFHSGAADNQSIGMDFNNLSINLVKHPDASPYPDGHPRIDEMRRHPRPKSEVKIISWAKVQHYGYTEAQWRSGLSVSRLLVRIFPDIAPEFPRQGREDDHTGEPLAEPAKFRGFLGHSASEAQRWDPGPGFDWPRLATAISPKWRR